MAYPRKEQHVNAETINQGRSIPLSEIGNPGSIEQCSDRVTPKDLDLMAFGEEKVQIMIHESAVEGTLKVETPSVNGVNMPIVRGVPTWVKRKYVECMARSASIGYKQESNPLDPSDIKMVERRVMNYPFSVLQDPNPRGAAWLESIRNSP